MRVGLVTYNLAKSWDIDTIIKNCSETGFLGVELRTTHAHGVELTLSDKERDVVREKFRNSPVDLASLGTTCEYQSPDPAELRKRIEETKAFIKLAHDVGAEGIKVRPNTVPKGAPLEKTLAQIGAAWRECAEYGERYGVRVNMEVHGRGTSRLANMAKIVEHADHDYARVTWNCNDEDLEGGTIEENFARVAHKIGFVHLRELYVDYPFQKLFRLLRGAGYDGFCCAEIRGSSDPIRVMQYYKALFDVLSAP